jgi:hypothetical protein
MVSGLRHHDPVKTLDGAADLSRGIFLGTVADAAVNHIPFNHAAVSTVGHVFSYASGALALTAGAVKYARGAPGSRERVEGLLDMGIGVCSLAATQGTLLYPAIGLQAGLAVTRLVVEKRDTLRDLGHRAAARAERSWRNLREVFRQAVERPAKRGE